MAMAPPRSLFFVTVNNGHGAPTAVGAHAIVVAVAAVAPFAVILADAGAPTVLALAPLAVIADAGAPSVLAPVLAVMLSDSVAPAVLAAAPQNGQSGRCPKIKPLFKVVFERCPLESRRTCAQSPRLEGLGTT